MIQKTLELSDFPYLTQGKKIVVRGLEVYREDQSHEPVGDAEAASNELQSEKRAFEVNAGQVPHDGPNPQAFLVVRYSIGGNP
jgi:hypothetical protein